MRTSVLYRESENISALVYIFYYILLDNVTTNGTFPISAGDRGHDADTHGLVGVDNEGL
jgi:hypothetical protein